MVLDRDTMQNLDIHSRSIAYLFNNIFDVFVMLVYS